MNRRTLLARLVGAVAAAVYSPLVARPQHPVEKLAADTDALPVNGGQRYWVECSTYRDGEWVCERNWVEPYKPTGTSARRSMWYKRVDAKA